MLLRVKIKNFTSFYNEVEFNMFPNLKRKTYINHIYSDYKVPLLKQTAIYGTNGSGKSNFLEGMQAIKDFASDKDFMSNFSFESNKFKLSGEKNTLSSSFFIEFEHRGIYFIYLFEINNDIIIKEELYESGLGEVPNALLYSREKNKITTSLPISDEVNKAITSLIKSNPKSSLLSLNNEFPIISDRKVKLAYLWFDKKFNVLSLRRVSPHIINMIEKEKTFFKFANSIMKSIDLGIEKVFVDNKKLTDIFNENSPEHDYLKNKEKPGSFVQNEKVIFTVDTEKGEKVIKQLLFQQMGLNGYHGEMPYNLQSDGTAKILNLLPALYNIINNDCLFCIDEIENSIHPNLILALLNFFASTKTKGQLIYTTHQTILLGNQSQIRPDEIWLTEKIAGNTSMYSLNDFKLHKTLNIENGYLAGRFGATPNIGDIEINTEDVK